MTDAGRQGSGVLALAEGPEKLEYTLQRGPLPPELKSRLRAVELEARSAGGGSGMTRLPRAGPGVPAAR